MFFINGICKTLSSLFRFKSLQRITFQMYDLIEFYRLFEGLIHLPRYTAEHQQQHTVHPLAQVLIFHMS